MRYSVLMEPFKYLGVIFTALIIAGCGDISYVITPQPVAPAPPPVVVVQASSGSVIISSDASSGAVGDEFTFSQNATFFDSAGNELVTPDGTVYNWVASDGRTFSGQTISIDFTGVGLFSVDGTAKTPNGVEANDDVSVTVFSTDRLGPAELDLPERYSDISLDDTVDVLDFLILAQQLGGIQEIGSLEAKRRADLDQDKIITDQDLDLLGNAILSGADLPTALISDREIRPFSKVTLLSPALLDPSANIELTIGGFQIEDYSRNIRGYAEVLIPRTVLGGSDVELIIKSNGVEVDSLKLTLGTSPAIPADPKVLLREYRDLLVELLPVVISNYEEIYGDGQISEIMERTQQVRIDTFTQALDQLDDEQSEITASFMVANGLDVGLETLRALKQQVTTAAQSQSIDWPTASNVDVQRITSAISSSSDICDVVDAVCGLRRFNEDYGSSADLVSDLCIVGALAAALSTGGLAGILGVGCIAIDSASIVNGVLNELAKEIDFRLLLDVTEVERSRVFNVFPAIEIKDGTGICSAAGSQVTDAARALVADKVGDVAEIVIIKKLRIKKIDRLVKRLGGDGIQAFEDFIQDSVDSILPTDRLADEVIAAFKPICEAFTLQDAKLIGTSDPLKLIAIDSAQGSLTPIGDGSANFTCAASSPSGAPVGNVLIIASKGLCRFQAVKTETVICGGTDVTVTFGDNGSLLDDIFAVEIGGQSFASNNPVRSQSGMVTLPSGSEQVVIMRGLAAPDGVGTYFIRFTGATVLSGQTSGSDLARGTTKRFVIRVD